MPKETFYHLPEQKQEQVLQAVRAEFETRPLGQASVKNIVTALGIARGSFYTYFEDLEESYFTVLARETIETHDLLVKALRRHEGKLFPALRSFGQEMAEELFKSERHALYRNRYLYWTADLDRRWLRYRENNCALGQSGKDTARAFGWEKDQKEIMQYIRALVHDLIRRLFTEGWDKKIFLSNYNYHLQLMEFGIQAALEQKGEQHGGH